MANVGPTPFKCYGFTAMAVAPCESSRAVRHPHRLSGVEKASDLLNFVKRAMSQGRRAAPCRLHLRLGWVLGTHCVPVSPKSIYCHPGGDFHDVGVVIEFQFRNRLRTKIPSDILTFRQHLELAEAGQAWRWHIFSGFGELELTGVTAWAECMQAEDFDHLAK
ncbi:hypothetical protein B0H17DRAFT_1148397 [Mycena rosella]|uniref:Uncharacterized protein n=1 Tax=Mycena rosella TaxID=1033263 RepID=A0AAD7CCZ1_MYCRO|nr:hypothetical protein B0H17DRAFT_1148397 [Mycena rosella]